MLIKGLEIGPDGVSNKRAINGHLIINQHSGYLQKTLKLKVSQDNKVLPSTNWISKLHKNPTKARFIITSPILPLNPLTNLITSVFKVMDQIVQNYNNKCCYFSDLNTSWTA